MNLYQNYSGVYDQFQPDYELFFQVIEETIQKYTHNPQSFLELACGTGNILHHYADKYEIVGIDISVSMLEQARKKLPNVPLFDMNMADFNLGRKFDIAVCMYDSINHLLKYEDWVTTFKCVRNHLNPGGVFLFDMNTVERLDRLSQSQGFVQQKDDAYLIMVVHKVAENLINWNVKIFQLVKENLYKLDEDNIKETSFSLFQITRDLETLFRKVHTQTIGDGTNMIRGRTFIICQV